MSETEILRTALFVCVDAMRRCSEEFCAAHGAPQTSDTEFDTALSDGEDALDMTGDVLPLPPAQGDDHADPT